MDISRDETTRITKKPKHADCPWNEAEFKLYVDKEMDRRDSDRKKDVKWLISTFSAFLLAFAAWVFSISNRVSVLEVENDVIIEMKKDIKELKQEVIKLRIDLAKEENP